MLKFRFPKIFLLSLVLLYGAPLTAGAHTTLLIPSQTSIEEKTAQTPLTEKDAKSAPAQKKDGQTQQKAAPVAANGDQAAKAGAAKDASQGKASASGKEAGNSAGNKDGAQAKPQPSLEAKAAPQAAAGTAAQDAPAAEAKPLPEKPAPAIGETVASVNSSILACASPENINQEVDMLIAGMDLFRHEGLDMDMPRIFTVYRFDPEARDRDKPVARDDLLGDIEEISYLGRKAWGTNVGLSRRGLYQFSIETRPWWDAARQGYEQQIVKTMLPVYGEDWGWHLPVGLSFEIVPLVCPFGLTAPAFFSAAVLVDGKPGKNLHVEVQRINTDNVKSSTRWQETVTERTNASGEFGAVLNRPGWWSCRVYRAGAPLKGPNGKPAPLKTSTVFWLYVDSLNGD